MGVRLNSSLVSRQLELDLKFPNHFTFPGLRKVSGTKTSDYNIQTGHFAPNTVPKGEISHSVEPPERLRGLETVTGVKYQFPYPTQGGKIRFIM